MYDFVEICEKVKFWILCFVFLLKEMVKLLNDSNWLIMVYRKVNVLIVDNEKNVVDIIEKIINFFEKICLGSEICSVVIIYLMILRVSYLKEERVSFELEICYYNEVIFGLLRYIGLRELEKLMIGFDVDEDIVFICGDVLLFVWLWEYEEILER